MLAGRSGMDIFLGNDHSTTCINKQMGLNRRSGFKADAECSLLGTMEGILCSNIMM